MRDNHYRSMCEFPQHYDAVIDLIKANNPYASVPDSRYEDAEEFATEAVHACIRAVIYGPDKWLSTGGCLAVRDTISGSAKAWLAYQPCL